MRRAFCVLAIAVCLPVSNAAAGAGLDGGAFLSRPMGARAAALGQSFTAVPSDSADGIIYNPASNAFISSPTVSASYLRGYAGDGTGLVAFAAKVGPVAITPAVLYYNAGVLNLNLSDGTQGSVTAEDDRLVMTAVSVTLFNFLALGGAFKYWKSELAQTASAKGVSYDVGALARLPCGFTAGAALQNMGADVKFEDVGDPQPKTTRAGLAWHLTAPAYNTDAFFDLPAVDVLFTGDYAKTGQEDGHYQSGLETNMNPLEDLLVSLRGGYMFGRDDQSVTFGAGLRQRGWGLDYAFGGSRHLVPTHQVTLSHQF